MYDESYLICFFFFQAHDQEQTTPAVLNCKMFHTTAKDSWKYTSFTYKGLAWLIIVGSRSDDW
jgi:hypothetical protein